MAYSVVAYFNSKYAWTEYTTEYSRGRETGADSCNSEITFIFVDFCVISSIEDNQYFVEVKIKE